MNSNQLKGLRVQFIFRVHMRLQKEKKRKKNYASSKKLLTSIKEKDSSEPLGKKSSELF